MRVNNLQLINFRNYTKKQIDFERFTLIVGENGVGKSNIIEAIYFLSVGKSFRADTDGEMISYGQSVAHVIGRTEDDELKIIINDGSLKVARKKFEVNGVARRMIDATGKIKAVIFSPTDMELVTGSPNKRRKYLDFVLSSVNREYRRCLQAYEKGLRQRNKLLDLIREGSAARTQLFFWDKTLIKNGQYITDCRKEFLELVGFFYDKSEISELRLKQYEQEELMAGSTLVGPHRDDFVMLMEDRDVAKFGSRGQQRMAVWWLKQKEIEFLGGTPILLLDDIFSELDNKHRALIMDFINEYQGQVIMTSAEDEVPETFKFDKVMKL